MTFDIGASADVMAEVALSDGAAETLAHLMRFTGKSAAEIIRDALFLERYAQEAWRDGGRVIIERGREKREVLPQ